MTTVITRWFYPLLVGLVLTGCSNLPMLNRPGAAEAELFAKGLDRYMASGDLATLKQLPQEYPQGAWRPRAEAIIDMADRQQQQKARLQQETKELAQCKTEKAALVEDNKILEVTLERLKQVLIDMELKAE
jgi:predicted secreted protein